MAVTDNNTPATESQESLAAEYIKQNPQANPSAAAATALAPIETPVANGTTDVSNVARNEASAVQAGYPVQHAPAESQADLAAEFAKQQVKASRPDFAKNPPPAAGPAPMQQVNPYTGAPATSYQATPAEATPAGHAAAVQQRESEQPVVSALGHTAIGFGKGAEETGHTVGRIINAATGDNIGQLPTSFQQPDYLRSDNGYETAGKVAEGVLEFVMGDESLKALPLGSKIGIAQKLAKVVSDEPYAAKIVEAGINASRMGLVSGVQSGLHTPTVGSVATGAATGFAGGVVGEALGAGANALTARTPAAAEAEAVESLYAQQLAKEATSDYVGTLAQNASERATGVESSAGSYGEVAQEIKNHFTKTYDELRESFGGVKNPQTGRYGANGFDDAINQIKNAKKVIYSPSPASTDALTQAEQELEKGQTKLQAMFSYAPEKYAEAQAGWAKASTLEDLHDVIDKSFTPSADVSGALKQRLRERAEGMVDPSNLSILNSDLVPQVDPKRFVSQVDKSIRKIEPEKLINALGGEGYDNLMSVRQLLKKATEDITWGKEVNQLTRQYLQKVGSSAVSKTLGGPAVGSTVGAASYLLGASNPVTAGLGLTAATAHFLYTHPNIGAPILKAASALAPAATQTLKQTITHVYNPSTSKVEATQ
jgi:hypothetical protein